MVSLESAAGAKFCVCNLQGPRTDFHMGMVSSGCLTLPGCSSLQTLSGILTAKVSLRSPVRLGGTNQSLCFFQSFFIQWQCQHYQLGKPAHEPGCHHLFPMADISGFHPTSGSISATHHAEINPAYNVCFTFSLWLLVVACVCNSTTGTDPLHIVACGEWVLCNCTL